MVSLLNVIYKDIPLFYPKKGFHKITINLFFRRQASLVYHDKTLFNHDKTLFNHDKTLF